MRQYRLGNQGSFALVDSTGAKVVEYYYDAWGKILSVTGTLATTLGVLNPFRYRGYVFDEETGLYYLRSRYYCSALARFISADKQLGRFHQLVSQNLYAYCNNCPSISSDPDGCEAVSLTVIGVAAVAEPTPFGEIAFALFGLYVLLDNLSQGIVSNASYSTTAVADLSIPTDLVVEATSTNMAPKRSHKEIHHIVAHYSQKATPARNVLFGCNIQINSAKNLVPVSYEFHRHMHSDAYYGYINAQIVSAYRRGQVAGEEKEYVEKMLKKLSIQIQRWDRYSGI